MAVDAGRSIEINAKLAKMADGKAIRLPETSIVNWPTQAATLYGGGALYEGMLNAKDKLHPL